MRRKLIFGLGGLLGTTMLASSVPGVALQAASVSDASRAACDGLRNFSQPDVSIVEAGVIEAGQTHARDNLNAAQRPQTAYCRVEARIEGNIRFLMYLPLREGWNGRMLGVGNGGDAGSFAIGGIAGAVRDGMSGITTDAGHEASDQLWALSRKKMEDYTHRAHHLTNVLGRDLSAAYYGKQPDYAYFSGCSGGGRQAQTEMQVFPDDYDGILAGSPASQHNIQMARKQWIVLAQEQQPQAALSNAQWTLVANEVTRQCDAVDGLTDGLVEAPMQCNFDPARLTCQAGQSGDQCLTPAQVGFVNVQYGPFRDENGREIGPRPTPGIRLNLQPPITGVNAYGRAVHQNPNWTRADLVISRDIAALDRMFPEMGPNDPELTKFAQGGGKAIIYTGWRDSTDIAAYTVQNYERMVAHPANGGLQRVQDTVRLFMAPISGHCNGNDGPSWQSPGQVGYSEEGDMLKLLIRWVEQGRAPAMVLGSQVNQGAVVRTRPLCPYPARPRYDGTGSVDDASNFVCR